MPGLRHRLTISLIYMKGTYTQLDFNSPSCLEIGRQNPHFRILLTMKMLKQNTTDINSVSVVEFLVLTTRNPSLHKSQFQATEGKKKRKYNFRGCRRSPDFFERSLTSLASVDYV